MGYYKCRQNPVLSAWQICACEYVFQGKDDEWICKQLLDVWTDKSHTEVDERKMKNAKGRLRRLKKTEAFLDYYNTIRTDFMVHNYGKAIRKLADQIDSSNEWLANKAANDVIAKAGKEITGDTENTINVRFEGLPELGSPDVQDDVG